VHPTLRDTSAFLSALVRGRLYRGGDRFVRSLPSPQTSVEALPEGAWASRLPLPGVVAGDAELFTDARATWAIEALGGVEGARCVELGPLEGGHSYMMQEAGASQVIAVEANKDAFLKCLIVKELFGLQRCSFLCGDALEYLRNTEEQFDLCWCAGILYHMVEPVELIRAISQRANRLYMWTHYYDPDKLVPGLPQSQAFASGQVSHATCDGYSYELHRHDYGVGFRFRGFWGGTRPYSHWLTLDGLLGALTHFGWQDLQTQLAIDHPHGPSVNLVARRAESL
jgi:Protein of unknown function (DUF1698)